ncbi:MAG TPA: hypothetical protein PLU30_08285 [Verrucomicrobiae bacterium]|nr:hypothetical protein [Verrucomicrobiae bacterium]
MRTGPTTLLLACCLLGGAAAASAQAVARNIQAATDVQRRQEIAAMPSFVEGEVPPMYEGESSDLGPQRLVTAKPAKPRMKWFEAWADSQIFYTSNFGFTEPDGDPDPIDTTMLVSTAEFALSPEWALGGGRFNPRLGYRHQWFNYDVVENDRQLNRSDFDIQTVFLELKHSLPGDRWRFGTGFEWSRYLGHEAPIEDYAEFYKEFMPFWRAQYVHPFGENSLLAAEYFGNLHVTEVTPTQDILSQQSWWVGSVADSAVLTDPRRCAYINDRMEHMLTVSWAQQVFARLVLRPYYRFMYTDYLKGDWGDRNDTLNTVGVIVSYGFTDWASVRAFVSYDHHESDDETIPDYRKLDTGGGVSFSVRF